MLKGDFAHKGSLQTPSIWERGILVEEITVLLTWKSLGTKKQGNKCYLTIVLQSQTILKKNLLLKTQQQFLGE